MVIRRDAYNRPVDHITQMQLIGIPTYRRRLHHII